MTPHGAMPTMETISLSCWGRSRSLRLVSQMLWKTCMAPARARGACVPAPSSLRRSVPSEIARYLCCAVARFGPVGGFPRLALHKSGGGPSSNIIPRRCYSRLCSTYSDQPAVLTSAQPFPRFHTGLLSPGRGRLYQVHDCDVGHKRDRCAPGDLDNAVSGERRLGTESGCQQTFSVHNDSTHTSRLVIKYPALGTSEMKIQLEC